MFSFLNLRIIALVSVLIFIISFTYQRDKIKQLQDKNLALSEANKEFKIKLKDLNQTYTKIVKKLELVSKDKIHLTKEIDKFKQDVRRYQDENMSNGLKSSVNYVLDSLSK